MQSEAQLSAARRTTILWLLVVISALGPVAMNGVLPANTAVVDDLATEYGLVQLVLTVYMAAGMVSQMLLGSLSDRVGRKPVMVLSLLVFAVGCAICASAINIEMLLLGRFVQGVGASVSVFLPRTIVRDIFPPDKSASVIGYITTAMMAGPLFGPALGGWVTDSSSWRFMYVGLGMVGVLMAVLCFFLQTETRAEREPGQASTSIIRGCAILFASRKFVALALVTCGSVGVYYAFLGGAPYVVMELYEVSASSYGRWFAMVAIGYFLGNFIAGRFSDRFGVERMILWGTLPGIAGMALFWLFSGWQHPIALFLPMLLIALWNGATLPNLMVSIMSVRPEIAGAASGLAGTLMTGIGIVLTLSLSLVLTESSMPLLLIMSASATLAGFGFLLLRGQ